MAFIREPKLMVLSLLSFWVGAGFAFGVSASNALLISRVGTESLFYVYFGSSVLTLGLSGIFYLLARRISPERLFVFSFEVFAVLILLLWRQVQLDPNNPLAYYAARLFFYAVFVVTNLEFWMVAGAYFTHLEAKHRYPILVAANVLGVMAGGMLLDGFATHWGAAHFFLLWGLMLGLAPCLLLPLKSQVRPLAFTPVEVKTEAPLPGSYRLMALLLLFWLAYSFLGNGVDYFFNASALHHFRDENELAGFFGRVAFFSLGLVMLYQLTLAKYLSSRLSVERSVMLIAVLFFVGVAALPFSRSLGTMTLAEGLFYYFIDFAAIALLMPVLNVFPEWLKGRVLVGVEGFGRPLGSLLLLVAALGLTSQGGETVLALVLSAAALLFLVYPFVFGRDYTHYLLACLQAAESPEVINAVQALGEPGKKKAIQPLLTLLKNTTEISIQREVVLALGRIRDPETLPRIVEMFSAPHESLQMAVVESLGSFKNYESLFALYHFIRSSDHVSFQVRSSATFWMTKALGRKMLPLLRQALEAAEPRMKANAIESIALLRDPETIPWLRPYLNHESRRVRANAAVALYPFRPTRAAALQTVNALFNSSDPFSRFSGIYAIGELTLKSFREALQVLVTDPDPRFHRHAVTALAKWGLSEYCQKFVAILLGEEEGVALESLRNLSRFSKSSRRRVFEIISRLARADLQRLLARFDQTPLDFSKERALLLSQGAFQGPRVL